MIVSNIVEGAKSKLTAYLAQPVSLKYFPSEEVELEARANFEGIKLPIAKGQCVGFIDIYEKSGKKLQTHPLYSSVDLNGTLFFKLKRGLTHPFESGFSLKLWALILGVILMLWTLRWGRKGRS